MCFIYESFQNQKERYGLNEEEFIQAADQYKDMIYRVALNYLGNPHDADDIVQEVLMKLYTCKKKFDTETYLRSWLIRVTVNKCKNILRMPWRKRSVSLDEAADMQTFQEPGQSELFQSVMKLSEKYRIVLYLFYYEEYAVKEIAGLLSVSESVVTSRLSRARIQLKSQLKEEIVHEQNRWVSGDV